MQAVLVHMSVGYSPEITEYYELKKVMDELLHIFKPPVSMANTCFLLVKVIESAYMSLC